MKSQTALIVTSIAKPNPILQALAEASDRQNFQFILIGDVPSPHDFYLVHCRFYSLDQQRKLPFQFARKCPERHYARKNIGYLIAISQGVTRILETDDDNYPLAHFGFSQEPEMKGFVFRNAGWINIYPYFRKSAAPIWPRGFPLSLLKKNLQDLPSLPLTDSLCCPIQQGLVQQSPDVDALWRLLFDEQVQFDPSEKRILLGEQSWCPFNSQNTTWFQKAFPLLYLPSGCSFRMTDIWRSFVAQRIAWTCGWGILFHEPTMAQERNEHDLMKDFEDEIPGYLQNVKICEALQGLSLVSGEEHLLENLRICYEMMVSKGFLPEGELDLLESWIADVSEFKR